MTIPRIKLRNDFETPRIIKGNWQIADDHNASINDDEMYGHMAAFVDAGVTAFDCGDIYYGVEERIGNFIDRFRTERGVEAARKIAVHTKYVPAFLLKQDLAKLTRKDVEATIDRSLKRLKVERLDVVQLHWWDYETDGNVETALVLEDLKKAGKIHHIGGTNYNVTELGKMIDAGVDVVINQVQYSLIDTRAKNGMEEFCRNNNVQLVCYGSMAGGLLSRKWLGIADPGSPDFENVSLDKYYRIVGDFGGWNLFQELLKAMETIARKHSVSIAQIASRYVIEQPSVAAVIQGARHARHLADNIKLFSFELDQEDYGALNSILVRAEGPQGDCYDLDRIENRDAVEDLSAVYFDVENGKLVKKTREIKPLNELYGHHLLNESSQ